MHLCLLCPLFKIYTEINIRNHFFANFHFALLIADEIQTLFLIWIRKSFLTYSTSLV